MCTVTSKDLPSRRDELPPYWGWRLLFCANLRGADLVISLNLHVNGDISLCACQGPAGLPDVRAKSISRPLPSCPSMHFIGTTLSLCSPALFPNELIVRTHKREGRRGGGREKEIVLGILRGEPPIFFFLITELVLRRFLFIPIKY